MIINLPDIPVWYVQSENGIAGSDRAFSLLESKLPTLKKRRFYGIVSGTPPDETYRACVEKIQEDKIIDMGLLAWVIPGGTYERRKIKNWKKNIPLIGKTFKEIMKECPVDLNRPQIEFYRNIEEMFVLVPIQ